MVYKYATQVTEQMAKAVRLSARISTKQAIEIANFIRGRKTSVAIRLLEGVIEQKVAVPYKRFNGDVGHKPGIGPGRYPISAAKTFLALVKQAVANAIDQSLDEHNLVIHAVVAHRGAASPKYGRIRGLQTKNTHVEIVVAEAKEKAATKKSKAKPKVEAKAKEPKVEAKAEVKTETKTQVKTEDKVEDKKAEAKSKTGDAQ